MCEHFIRLTIFLQLVQSIIATTVAWVSPPEIAGNSLKIPPAWDPANEEAATELFPQQIGPSIALRVAGPARELLRDIPVQQLQQGAMVDRSDGNGPQQFTGIQLVTFVLSQRFAPLSRGDITPCSR